MREQRQASHWGQALIFCDFAVKELSDEPEDAYEAIVRKTLQAWTKAELPRADATSEMRLYETIGGADRDRTDHVLSAISQPARVRGT